jgi:hypothetical protein
MKFVYFDGCKINKRTVFVYADELMTQFIDIEKTLGFLFSNEVF